LFQDKLLRPVILNLFQDKLLRLVILNLVQDNASTSPVILKQVQDDEGGAEALDDEGGWFRVTLWVVQCDEGGECLPSLLPSLSASSAPLRESILHAEAQRTQRLCTKIKAVCVARRRDTSSAFAHALDGVA
jgi:hypothetical protein